MTTKYMLIDANHPEETRVVVLNGNRLEDFDVEVSSRKQIKGNIYLAKVVRVEPSLQAAFVEYGGNRHGFLTCSEIHPDYYQIPLADRESLAAAAAEQNDEDKDGDPLNTRETSREKIETLGGSDPVDELKEHCVFKLYRNYKIQEVIKRGQILLVQVVKEERGNKGAALTTYLSLAGRYCVLMPNATHSGGVSRKINNVSDRNRLKSILADINIPKGMAAIVRTAGARRSKAEIKRDHDYLIHQWNNIREKTLNSTAPCLICEESDLIKRAIRDIYDKDIGRVIIEGSEGYRTAKEMMKMLIPSHAKKVQFYKDQNIPLYHRYQVESQLDTMHNPTVRLRSGGYIVINPTEALVSIDVNSGRATQERNIEETACKTNLEAAEEIARQLRLRDLAGLIVIDFIDMEDSHNQAQVERRLKESMRLDRARIQIGHISHFGLLEMSRQRLRPSLIETSFSVCPHCGGTGVVRSTESAALHLLRTIEKESLRRRTPKIIIYAPTNVALYILNHKRLVLANIEARYETVISLMGDDSLTPPNYRIERITPQKTDDIVPTERPVSTNQESISSTSEGEEKAPKQKKQHRRSRSHRSDKNEKIKIETVAETPVAETPDNVKGEESTEGEKTLRKKRWHGRRGGRQRSKSKIQSPTSNIQKNNTDETEIKIEKNVPNNKIPVDVTPSTLKEDLDNRSISHDEKTNRPPSQEEKRKKEAGKKKISNQKSSSSSSTEVIVVDTNTTGQGQHRTGWWQRHTD